MSALVGTAFDRGCRRRCRFCAADWESKSEASAPERSSGIEAVAEAAAAAAATSENTTRSAETREPAGGLRAAFATGGGLTASGSFDADGRSNRDHDPALCILEHGLGLDATFEGCTGLPADDAVLLAQPLANAGSRTIALDHRRPGKGAVDSGGRETIGECDGTGGGYALLVSDRARSQTHVMVLSPEGEVEPVAGGKVRYGLYGRCGRCGKHLSLVFPRTSINNLCVVLQLCFLSNRSACLSTPQERLTFTDRRQKRLPFFFASTTFVLDTFEVDS